ncbi:MAG: flagellar protein [Firmicutes bacterium]|nr:flagellar protein [Bacillota bacterium]
MAERIFPPIPPVSPVDQVRPSVSKQRTTAPQREAVANFQEILSEKLAAELKISAHAQKRMAERGINLSPREIEGIKEAVAKAQTKGCRDSLVVLDRVALVVSVENKTVITAVDAGKLKDNVFTNIDSAVFVRNV